ncbi:MAG: MFS transporter [Candidatus Accumulibacter sp.]|jgi:YNFM family putative membrane transporter|nr:MFS transporter [Accumulibacter sp.]
MGEQESVPRWIKLASAEYRRAAWALFLAGFACYSLIYCVQPLLPAFADTFGVSPAESSLALSLTTGLLAFAIVLASAASQALGRRGLMFGSILLAAICDIVAAATPSWAALLAARAIEGFVIGGVPAVAIAYLSEEIEPASLGRAMGLYVAGTAFGGMMGRIGMGILTEFTSWRVALGIIGVSCLAAAIGFLILLPPSRNFIPRRGFDLALHLRAWQGHLVNRALLRIYAYGFLITSVFVTLFNYAVFRLSIAPHSLSQMAISLIFLVYGFGMVSSSVAGALADRFGRRPPLLAGFLTMLIGVLATLPDSLTAILGGIVLMTVGFFVVHSVASGSIGPLAGEFKAHAASLYLLFYYLGSSIVGSAGGWFWQHGGWPAIVGLTAILAVTGLWLAATAGNKEGG